jgi:hypothetical protein
MNDRAMAALLSWRRSVDAVWEQQIGMLSSVVAQLPPPPSDAELLRDHHVSDDAYAIQANGSTTTWTEIGAALASPFEIPLHLGIKSEAETQAETIFGGEPGRASNATDNDRDAFRHAYWNALMTLEFGEESAERVATAHEALPDETSHDTRAEAMDLYNNQVGREIAVSLGPNATREDLRLAVEQAVRDGKLVSFNEDKSELVHTDGQVDFPRPPPR